MEGIAVFGRIRLGDAPKKKQQENVGILKKQGGGSTRIPLPFFTVFYMGDPPKKGPKMQNRPYFFQKKNTCHSQTGGWGGGGVPHLGKIPTFSRFFWGGASLGWYVLLGLKNGVKSTSTQFYCGLG